MRTTLLFSTLTLITIPAVLAADASMLRPGRWEVTLQLDFGDKKIPEGMPFAAPMRDTSCLTKDQIEKHRALVPPPDQSCKVSDYKNAGAEISYSVRCDDVAMQVKATIHSPEYFTGLTSTHGKDPTQNLVMKISGRRIGDKCTAEELADAKETDDE